MQERHLLVANGPNLSLLGLRQPHIYGFKELNQIIDEVKDICQKYNSICMPFQSDTEGEMLSWLGQWVRKIHAREVFVSGLIINAGGWSHSSIALGDCLAIFSSFEVPIVEVHISNIYGRESFRHNSYISPHAVGVVSGLGSFGYQAAAQYLLSYERKNAQEKCP